MRHLERERERERGREREKEKEREKERERERKREERKLLLCCIFPFLPSKGKKHFLLLDFDDKRMLTTYA